MSENINYQIINKQRNTLHNAESQKFNGLMILSIDKCHSFPDYTQHPTQLTTPSQYGRITKKQLSGETSLLSLTT